jgi:hypothetical protein
MAIHGPTDDPPEGNPSGWKGEAKIAGIVTEVDSDGGDHRFLIDIQQGVVTRLNEGGDRLLVESWTEARGYRIIECE